MSTFAEKMLAAAANGNSLTNFSKSEAVKIVDDLETLTTEIVEDFEDKVKDTNYKYVVLWSSEKSQVKLTHDLDYYAHYQYNKLVGKYSPEHNKRLDSIIANKIYNSTYEIYVSGRNNIYTVYLAWDVQDARDKVYNKITDSIEMKILNGTHLNYVKIWDPKEELTQDIPEYEGMDLDLLFKVRNNSFEKRLQDYIKIHLNEGNNPLNGQPLLVTVFNVHADNRKYFYRHLMVVSLKGVHYNTPKPIEHKNNKDINE